jgi:hypothetical protein
MVFIVTDIKKRWNAYPHVLPVLLPQKSHAYLLIIHLSNSFVFCKYPACGTRAAEFTIKEKCIGVKRYAKYNR